MKANRGFTLVELLTGMAVSSIILVAVAAAVIGISGSYSNESQTRSAVEGGRTGLAFIERNLKLAGYGIEPAYAFSFAPPPPASGTLAKDNHAVIDDLGATPYLTDDLAFRYRDPYFVRRGDAAATVASFSMTTPSGRGFPRGTAFIVACPGGGQRAWFRSSAAVGAAATSIALVPYGLGQNAAPPTPLDCIGQGGADGPYLMHLREFRFRVFSEKGRSFLGYVPSLMSNVDTFPTDCVPNPTFPASCGEVLVADVEEFQVSYLMNRPPPSGPPANSAYSGTLAPDQGSNWVMGDQPGEIALPTSLAPMPKPEDAYDSANRYNAHPANIRGVQLSFSVRSTRERSGKGRGYIRGSVENGPDAGSVGDGYFRSWMSTSVRTANMTSRSFFLPPLSSGGNVNGNEDGA